MPPDRESGFTLIEVLLATALFALVSLTALESVRHLVDVADRLLERQNEDRQLKVTTAQLRSDALSASAIWIPPSSCGDAVSFMKPDAAGLTFVTYVPRGGALVRLTSNDPIDPCAAGLASDPMISALSGFRTVAVPASQLPSHTDPGSGAVDGGIFAAAPHAVAADGHVADYDGSEITSGNGVVEAVVDAPPVRTAVDLVAGIRPAGLSVILQYACSVRCAANEQLFPELRGTDVGACSYAADFQDDPKYYAPFTFGLVDAGGGKKRIVVTSYHVAFRYAFTFSGVNGTTVYRTWSAAQWPPGANLSDPYPFAYGAPNAVNGTSPDRIAADLNEPAAFAGEIATCTGLGGDPKYSG